MFLISNDTLGTFFGQMFNMACSVSNIFKILKKLDWRFPGMPIPYFLERSYVALCCVVYVSCFYATYIKNMLEGFST